jgi:hypothetical protein
MSGAGAAGTALSVGGSVLGALNGAAAARKKNGILTNGTREQDRYGMEATRATGDFLQQLRGSRANPAPERAAFTGALGAGSVGGLPTASSRFRSDAAGATNATQGYGRNMADLFARIRAPQLQRQNENEMMVGLGNTLKPIQMQSQDSQFLTNLRAGMTQPNPWLNLLSQGMQQGGNYMVANG